MKNSNTSKIKRALAEAGVTQKEIAAALGVSPQAVHQVVAGVRPTYRIRKAIAEACSITFDDLWPEE